MKNLEDAQWCALDLLMRAKQKGQPIVSRKELLYAANVPEGIRVKLAWAMLTMPNGFVEHVGNDFKISAIGEKVFSAMFKKPTNVGDAVINLTDQTRQ